MKLVSDILYLSKKRNSHTLICTSLMFTHSRSFVLLVLTLFSPQRASVRFFLFLFGMYDLSRQMYCITVQFFHAHSGTVKNHRQQKAHKDNNVEFKMKKKKKRRKDPMLMKRVFGPPFGACTKTGPDHLQLVQLSFSLRNCTPVP